MFVESMVDSKLCNLNKLNEINKISNEGIFNTAHLPLFSAIQVYLLVDHQTVNSDVTTKLWTDFEGGKP